MTPLMAADADLLNTAREPATFKRESVVDRLTSHGMNKDPTTLGLD